MTCGSHLAAAVSPFERRQGIERKRQVTKFEVPKKTPRKESWLHIEDDMRVPFSSSGLNVSKAARDQKKKEVARNQGVKKNPRIERILVHRGWHAGPMILHRKRLDRRTLNEMARSRKKTMPERLPSGPYIPRRCGFALTRPANPRFRDAPRPGPPYATFWPLSSG